jgi:cytochrome P450
MLYLSSNRDEAQFEWSDAFDLARSSNNHLGFGAKACTSA